MSRSPSAGILADLRQRGARVHAEGDRLRVKAPEGIVSAETRQALAQNKPELLAQLDLEARLLEFPLSRFETDGCPIEIAVPGLSETLWFVPGEADAEALIVEGVRRGRIWTAVELRDLLAAPWMIHGDAISIARAKVAFNATVVDVQATDPPDPIQSSLDLHPQPRQEDNR